MTAAPRSAGRFQMAPVVAGGAVWDESIDLVLAPIRLSRPVFVVLPGQSRTARP